MTFLCLFVYVLPCVSCKYQCSPRPEDILPYGASVTGGFKLPDALGLEIRPLEEPQYS